MKQLNNIPKQTFITFWHCSVYIYTCTRLFSKIYVHICSCNRMFYIHILLIVLTLPFVDNCNYLDGINSLLYFAVCAKCYNEVKIKMIWFWWLVKIFHSNIGCVIWITVFIHWFFNSILTTVLNNKVVNWQFQICTFKFRYFVSFIKVPERRNFHPHYSSDFLPTTVCKLIMILCTVGTGTCFYKSVLK